MDKTYYSLYKSLYGHFHRFCISGDSISRKQITLMRNEIESTKDIHLEQLYKIVDCATNLLDGNARDNLNSEIEQYKMVIEPDAYEDQWRLYSVLCMIFQYIYPSSALLNVYAKNKEETLQKLDPTTIEACEVAFNGADYAIQNHIEKELVIKDAYVNEFENRDFRLNNRSFLTVLKGFSSSTPFFYSALKERFHHIAIKGGGLFVKWKGYGVVIDPGINFMENMHMTGLNIDDINYIIVTHNHIDHNGDLTTIDDLASQFNKQNIVLYVDKETYDQFNKRLPKFASKNIHCIDLAMTQSVSINDNITANLYETKHIIDNDKNYEENVSFALKLELKEEGKVKVRIGFTSDTKYFPELVDSLKDCDYLIANISETSKEDYFKQEDKDAHLGYNGCKKLIEKCNTEREQTVNTLCGNKPIYIISEFWAGKGDIRKELISRLRKTTGYDAIYPGDIGMLYFLDQPTFLCGYCGCERDLKDMHAIKQGVEYAPFSNVCSDCVLL